MRKKDMNELSEMLKPIQINPSLLKKINITK